MVTPASGSGNGLIFVLHHPLVPFGRRGQLNHSVGKKIDLILNSAIQFYHFHFLIVTDSMYNYFSISYIVA